MLGPALIPLLLEVSGVAAVYVLVGVVALAAVVTVAIFGEETKGRPLETITAPRAGPARNAGVVQALPDARGVREEDPIPLSAAHTAKVQPSPARLAVKGLAGRGRARQFPLDASGGLRGGCGLAERMFKRARYGSATCVRSGGE